MYIGRETTEEKEVEDRISGFFSGSDNRKKEELEAKRKEEEFEKNKALENTPPKLNFIHNWEAQEHEVFEKSKNWYLVAALILVAIIAYSVYTNSPVMSITFILIGVVGYIFLNKEPRILKFGIIEEGMVAGKEIYPFENINSFWIFYEPDNLKVVSLKMKSKLVPIVHIPIGDEDPVMIREMLLEYIPEEKQELSVADRLERIFGI